MFEFKEICENGDVNILETENLETLKREVLQTVDCTTNALADDGNWSDRTYEFTFKTADVNRFDTFIKNLKDNP